MKSWYKDLENRYTAFSEEVQILNVVSDLHKADNLNRINPEGSNNHILRAIILIDYMVDDVKWRKKLKELLRLREVVASLTVNGEPYGNFEQVITAALLLAPAAYCKMKENL